MVPHIVIPLILYTDEYKMNGENMFKEILELIFLCIVFIGVLGLTYFVTKKVGTLNKKIGFHRNMEIIEVLPLIQGQYLCIVKVGTCYYLIGCAQKGNMTYLKELDSNELIFQDRENVSFQEQFMHFMKGKQKTDDEKNK